MKPAMASSQIFPSEALCPLAGGVPWLLLDAAGPAAKSAGPTSCRPFLSGRAKTAIV
jgi:hypothetical protein